MSLPAANFVPFDTGIVLTKENGKSVLRYKTIQASVTHHLSQLALLATVFGGWFSAILLMTLFITPSSSSKGSLAPLAWIVGLWALQIAASVLWLRKTSKDGAKGRLSDRHILLEDDAISGGDGERYAKVGITSVWAQEPDGAFTHRGGLDYAISKAQADARMETRNSVWIQYGDTPIQFVKPILRRAVAERLAQAIEDWRTT